MPQAVLHGESPRQRNEAVDPVFDYFPAVRSGDRVTVKGDKPFYNIHSLATVPLRRDFTHANLGRDLLVHGPAAT